MPLIGRLHVTQGIFRALILIQSITGVFRFCQYPHSVGHLLRP